MMKYAVALSTAVSFLIIAPLVFMFLDTTPPYEYDVERSYVIPKRTPSGRQMTVHWQFKKINRICSGSITRYIIDKQTDTRISYDPIPAAVAGGATSIDNMSLERTFFLPPELSIGPKFYYSDGLYACNIVQRFFPLHVRTPRLPFEVTE